MKIKEFKPGEKIEGFYIIKDVNIKTSSNNKKYLDFNIMDASGEVNCKLWDLQNNEEETYKAGNVIKIRGDVTLWQQSMQLKIVKIRLTDETDEIDYSALIPSAPIEAKAMFEELDSFIEAIEDQDLRKLTSSLIDSVRDKLAYYPAAKSNHHSIRSGLLYHVIRMLRVAKSLCDIYGADRSLLYTGVMLHDLEKINEMNSDTLGIVGEYTIDGNLLGHIIQGIVNISKEGEKLGISDEKIRLVQHMILSHHYQPEYGSPKKPMFLEAELLHYIDMIDARVYDFEKVYRSIDPGTFSDYILQLDRRRVYRPNL